MNTIFFLDNVSNIDNIRKTIQKHENSTIFSLDYITHRIFEKNQINHVIGETYLSTNDHKTIDDYTINTTLNWANHNSIKECIIFDDINLKSLIEMESIQYFSSIYRNVISILRIIEKEKPNLVICYSKLNDFIQRVCNSKNIKVIASEQIIQDSLTHDTIHIKFNIFSFPFHIKISRTKFFQIKKLIKKITNSIYRLEPPIQTSKKNILLLDFNPVVYRDLLVALSALNNNILLLNQRKPAVHSIHSLQIVRKTGCKIINLDLFEKQIHNKIQNETEKMSVNINKIWNINQILENIFSFDSYTFWYSIKNSFTTICNSRFLEAVRRILLLNEFFDKYDVSIILEWAETGQEEKEALHTAKKRKIKSVLLQHAMYPTAKIWEQFGRFLSYFSYQSLSDYQAVYGDIMKEYAIAHGYKKEKLLITGSPRHDQFFNFTNCVKDKNLILIATTGSSGIAAEYSTTMARLNYDNFTKETIRVVKLFPDKKIVVKIAPHQEHVGIANVMELIKRIDPNIPIVTNANLPELISSCDILITFNNSTIALESLILNKPTVSIQTENWLKDEDIVKMGAILSIDKIEEIESGIKKILYDKKFRDQLKNNAQIFLQKYMANGGNASKVLAQELDKFSLEG